MVRGRKKIFQYDVCLTFMIRVFFGFSRNSNMKPVKSEKECQNRDFWYSASAGAGAQVSSSRPGAGYGAGRAQRGGAWCEAN